MPEPLRDDEMFGPSALPGPTSKFVVPDPRGAELRKLALKEVVIKGEPGVPYEIILNGGPSDGVHMTFAKKPGPAVFFADKTQKVAELQERVKAHCYLERGDGVNYDYQGVKSCNDLVAGDDDEDGGELVEV
jgi:hypothetical protein